MRVVTRWASLWDVPEALSFIIAGKDRNSFDSRVMSYPTTKIVRAEDEAFPGAIAYMPIHTTITLESLGFSDSATASDRLSATTAMCARVADEACKAGIRELWFISSDDGTDELAMKELGFEPVKAYRKRLLCE